LQEWTPPTPALKCWKAFYKTKEAERIKKMKMSIKSLFTRLGRALSVRLIMTCLIVAFSLIQADVATAQIFTALHDFSALENIPETYTFTNSDGAIPEAGLILSGNTLYGTASEGGIYSYGTVFSVNIDGTDFTNLHSFAGYPIDGYNPYGVSLLSGLDEGARL
jgi:uncharacterized repeat protein (TIGR03803 family)